MYARNPHNRSLSAVSPVASTWSGLEQALEAETRPYETLFSKDYTSEELKEDNETFSIALLDTMDLNGQVQLISAYQIPVSIGNWTIIKLMCAAVMSAQANAMNLSLRQEYTRIFLDNALVESGVTEGGVLKGYTHLGSALTALWDKVKKLTGGFVDNVQRFFSNLGKNFGEGLRKFGDGIRRIFQITYDFFPFSKYLLDFVGLTPGVKFIFGDLFREIGLGLETGESIEWKAVAAGGAEYLKEMAFRLKIAGTFLPQPWGLIAKIVAVIFEAGSKLIMGALQQHMAELYADWQERTAAAREAYEKQLFETVYSVYGIEPPKQASSLYGSSGSSNTGLILFGGLAVILGLGILR